MRRYMIYKLLITFCIIAPVNSAVAQDVKLIDPTGTYTLAAVLGRGHNIRMDGTISVSLLAKSRIAVSYLGGIGMPYLNEGFFSDTLAYRDNTAIYINSVRPDDTCTITMRFFADEVVADQKMKTGNGNCGFGQYVNADGSYKKTSPLPAVLNDPAGQ